jgi:hypothetical protein
MIVARFMEVFLSYARMQVNTSRCVNSYKRLGPGFINGAEPGPLWPDQGRYPDFSNLGEISGDTMIGRGIAARTSVILKSRSCDHSFRHLPRGLRLPLRS